MNPSVSHPSVRIKGTENNYEPVQCVDINCDKTWPHMHCPFCVKAELFQDPVILKAHYRVKHVDKGIEFAGLKILRCCERCSIVGTIKGTKEFKGAHWHCYRCRNGFTRRDEAIKHYRTHFRNPSTTFQIQVAQDINQLVDYQMKDTETGDNGQQMVIIENVITSAGNTTTAMIEIPPSSPLEGTQAESQEVEKSQSGEIQVSVAANETVDTCGEGQTFMIIHDEGGIGQAEVINAVEPIGTQLTPTVHRLIQAKQIGVKQMPRVTAHWRQEKSLLESEVRDIRAENTRLLTEKDQIDIHWGTELENIKVQLQMANAEIAAYQKREVELLNQLKVPLDERINDLLTELKTQHTELLHHQLAQLRRTYISQLQEELNSSSVQKSPVLPEETVTMSIVQPSQISSIMATVSGSNNSVLTTPGSYTGTLNNGNLVLMAEDAVSTPLFVVSHPHIPEIKAELKDNIEEHTIINTALLATEEPTDGALVEYDGVGDQEDIATDSEQVLLNPTIMSQSSDNELLAPTLDPDTNVIEFRESIDIHSDSLTDTGKRKLEDAVDTEADGPPQAKHLRGLD